MFLAKVKTKYGGVDYDLNILKHVVSKSLNRQEVSVSPYW